MMKSEIAASPVIDAEENKMTPEEIREILIRLARKHIDEEAARPAIEALNKIMQSTTSTSEPLTGRKPAC